MSILCTTCGYRRGDGESGPAALCPNCNSPYTAAALRDRDDTPPEMETPPSAPLKISWPRSVSVEVVDIDISFISMVWLFIKASFAIIPAALIVTIIWFVFVSAVGSRFS